ncbi:hypothetical protein LCGC14_2158740 [marine sediment metagenome]|uniref:Uncharacterized protein n=1 Tax=marine sediment metagenome TaxID=412755 RepID=A0A0F9GPG5_9ZZZZ
MTSPYDGISGSPLDTFAFEPLTVDATVGGVPFTEATMNPSGAPPAYAAFCTVEDAAIRIRLDGTGPTAAVGTLFNIGDTFVVWGRRDLMSARFIRQGAVSAVLSTQFARQVA